MKDLDTEPYPTPTSILIKDKYEISKKKGGKEAKYKVVKSSN